MKKIVFLLFFAGLLYSCNDTVDNGQQTGDSLTAKTGGQVSKEEPGEQVTPTLGEVTSDYRRMCNNPLVIDTTVIIEQDTFRIGVKHYCILSARTAMPKNVLAIWALDSFTTHPFETHIYLWKNGASSIDTVVNRDFFNSVIEDAYLKEYGALFPPNLRVSDSLVSLGYSISVPLSDVGIGAELSLIKDGKIKLGAKRN